MTTLHQAARPRAPWDGEPTLDHLTDTQCACVCVHVRVREGVRIWQTMPRPALLSLLYLINVIYLWSSVVGGDALA